MQSFNYLQSFKIWLKSLTLKIQRSCFKYDWYLLVDILYLVSCNWRKVTHIVKAAVIAHSQLASGFIKKSIAPNSALSYTHHQKTADIGRDGRFLKWKWGNSWFHPWFLPPWTRWLQKLKIPYKSVFLTKFEQDCNSFYEN